MPKEITKKKYIQHLTKAVKDNKSKRQIIKNAYTNALDTRKFEIELYWKRALYFWGFLVVIFAGFFALITEVEIIGDKIILSDLKHQLYFSLLLMVSLLGYLFSLGWLFVNKGSKVWQKNWEKHIDLLEDEINGPMFKTVIRPNLNSLKILSYFPYSVSKVNLLLSIFIVVFWLLVLNILVYNLIVGIQFCNAFFSMVSLNTLIFILSYVFHYNAVSFMYKDFRRGRKSSRTYIIID